MSDIRGRADPRDPPGRKQGEAGGEFLTLVKEIPLLSVAFVQNHRYVVTVRVRCDKVRSAVSIQITDGDVAWEFIASGVPVSFRTVALPIPLPKTETGSAQ